jgi:hypothetical protein
LALVTLWPLGRDGRGPLLRPSFSWSTTVDALPHHSWDSIYMPHSLVSTWDTCWAPSNNGTIV